MQDSLVSVFNRELFYFVLHCLDLDILVGVLAHDDKAVYIRKNEENLTFVLEYLNRLKFRDSVHALSHE